MKRNIDGDSDGLTWVSTRLKEEEASPTIIAFLKSKSWDADELAKLSKKQLEEDVGLARGQVHSLFNVLHSGPCTITEPPGTATIPEKEKKVEKQKKLKHPVSCVPGIWEF